MAYRKHHDIWRGPIIECYGNADRPQKCSLCASYGNCTKPQRGKSVCKAFAFASKGEGTAKQKAKPPRGPKGPAPKAQEPRDWVALSLRSKGVCYADRRDCGGYLWVVGGCSKQMKQLMDWYAERGAAFEFSDKGCAATNHRPGWFLRGYPKKAAMDGEPAGEDADKAANRKADEKVALRAKGAQPIYVGDRVEHAVYGRGVVMGVRTYGGSTTLAEVRFGDETQYVSARMLARGEVWKAGGRPAKPKKRQR